jgi:hypothetical protein
MTTGIAETSPTRMARIAEMSPRRMARTAGVFFLLTIAAGIFAQAFVSQRLVSGDAATTATNIMSHQSLFQLGFSAYMIEMVCQVIQTMLFYELLKPVSRRVSLLAAVLGVVGCGIKAMSRLFYIAPWLVLGDGGGSRYLSVFSTSQLDALTLLFLNVNDLGAAIALVFFGFNTVLVGYLIIRSWFWPRALGWLALVGGIGWLAFLSPPLGYRLFAYAAGIGIIGSLATIGWLLVVGVNEQRWREQARVAEVSIWR